MISLDSSCADVSLLRSGGTEPKVIFSAREPIAREEKSDPERFLFLTLRALRAALEELFAKRLPAPEKIICLLSSPWNVSEIRKIRMSKNAPFTFTAKLADELLRREAAVFQEELEDGYDGIRMEPIELKTIKSSLNGYPTASPFGQRIRELELSILITLAPAEALEKLRNAIAGYFHNMELRFLSSSFASFSAARDLFPEDSFLLVEAGGEITDLSLVKKGELAGILSFPLGANLLPRIAAGLTGSGLSGAVSSLSAHSRGQAERSLGSKLAKASSEASRKWLGEFERSLSEISADVALPSSVVLSADQEYADFFRDAIGEEQSHQYDWTESKFRTVFLRKDALRSLYLHRLL